ncbi:MAG: TraB/GumN family protein [Sphaerochaetaceae bacterium]|nr:TraB/GumN family protein [Sphaerochaetaceae bacterium]
MDEHPPPEATSVIIEKLTDTQHKITCADGKEIILIGTAHVSAESVNEVEQVIDATSPDVICIELDEGRYRSKTEKKGWENLDIKQVLKQNKGFLLLANLALSSYQKKLGDKMGISPGDEIMKGAEIATERDIPLELCDREIEVTFKRAWRLSNWWNKAKLISSLLTAAFSKEEISDEEIESLKGTNMLQSMLDEMAQELPTIKRVLIDERDEYLATKIYRSKGRNVVAVVGAGHAPGLIRHMEKLDSSKEPYSLRSISSIPKASPAGKIFSWGIVVALLALIAVGFIRSGWTSGLTMFLYWFGLNASLTALASIIGLAHPLTVIVSTVSAPITALSPTLGVGMVAGILEVSLRKPRVLDFESLTEDILHIKGWYRNRVIHPLFLFFITSIFASIGTFIAFPLIIQSL